MRRLAAALGLVVLLALPVCAEPPFTPRQPENTKNQEVTGAAGAATVVSLVAPATAKAHLVRLDARCSSGQAQITITDGVSGPTIWSSPPSLTGTLTLTSQWSPPLAGSFNQTMVITLSPCGGQNAVGVLDVQAHVF